MAGAEALRAEIFLELIDLAMRGLYICNTALVQKSSEWANVWRSRSKETSRSSEMFEREYCRENTEN